MTILCWIVPVVEVVNWVLVVGAKEMGACVLLRGSLEDDKKEVVSSLLPIWKFEC